MERKERRATSELLLASCAMLARNEKNALNRQQKEMVGNFIAFTGGSQNQAINFLEAFGWNVERAADQWFQNPPSAEEPTVDVSTVDALFSAYSDDEGEEIGAENLQRFFDDLGLADDDIVTLVLAWKCECKNIGVITKDEFLTGMKAMQVSSLTDLKAKLTKLRQELHSEKTFKDFYVFLFDYAKGDNPHKKVIELSFAIALWEMTLKDRFRLYDKWIAFLKDVHKKPISRDTWQLLYDFSKTDPSKYDASEAWPVLIDEFVEYVQDNEDNE